MNNDTVNDVVNGVNLNDKTFVPLTPDPLNKNTFSLAKIGKAVEDDAMTLNLPHAVLVNSLDLDITFVASATSNKPFGAPVTGSWSKRWVSAGTSLIKPASFTRVAVEARVNDGTGNVTVVGAMIGIVRSMAAVVARYDGTAM